MGFGGPGHDDDGSGHRRITAIGVTAALIVSLELMQLFTSIAVANAAPLLLTSIVFAVFHADARAGGVSAGLAVVYQWIALSARDSLFSYTRENLMRALLFTAAAPLIVGMGGKLKRRVVQSGAKAGAAVERGVWAPRMATTENLLEGVLRQLPAGVVIMGRDGAIVSCNQRAADVLGHDPQDIHDPAVDRLLHSDGSPVRPTERPLVRALEGEEIASDEMMYIRGDGKTIYLSVRAAPIRDSAGKITHAVATLDDISAQKRAAQAAQELAAVVENSDDAIYSLSPSGLVITWNPGAERLFGYTAAEMSGQRIERIVPEDRRAEMVELLEAARQGSHMRAPRPTERLRKDGTRIPVALRFSPLLNRQGRITAVVVVCHET